MIDPDLSAAMSKRKVEEAVRTGAQAIVTNCQQCVRTMTTYAKRNKVNIEVLDMSQLVARSLQAHASEAKARADSAAQAVQAAASAQA